MNVDKHLKLGSAIYFFDPPRARSLNGVHVASRLSAPPCSLGVNGPELRLCRPRSPRTPSSLLAKCNFWICRILGYPKPQNTPTSPIVEVIYILLCPHDISTFTSNKFPHKLKSTGCFRRMSSDKAKRDVDLQRPGMSEGWLV